MPHDALDIGNLETGAPEIGAIALSQTHMLHVSFVTGAPVIGPVSLGLDPFAIWPFKPNWRHGVQLTYEYKTDLFTTEAGREQRRALRNEPRKDWEFTALAYRTNFRDKIAQVTSRFDSDFYFANPIYRARLDVVGTAGASSFSVDEVPDWLVADAIAILISGTVSEAVLVTDVTGTVISIAGVLMHDWSAGTMLHLAETIKTATSLKTVAETSDVITLKNDLLVAVENVDFSGVSVAGEAFNGRELFLKKPNWSSTPDIDFSSERTDVDFGFGRRATYSPVPFVQRDTKATFLGRSLAETEEIINLFKRMKGRQGEFYMPTDMIDLVAASPLVSGQATLTVAGRTMFSAFNSASLVDSALVLKALIVFLRNGTHLPRVISSVARSGENSVFTLASTWPSTIAVADILKISFLPVVRFGVDALQIDFSTDSVAEFDLPIHALEALPAE